MSITIKQKKAFKRVVENRGNVSKAMREVGYSPITAKNPKNLTDSKGWQELMKEYLPDDFLAKKHRELLEAKTKDKKIDVTAVSKGLDMGYKLKGNYAPEKKQTLNLNIEVKPNKKAQSIADKYEKELRDSLKDEKKKT